jgi:hypothetical protein
MGGSRVLVRRGARAGWRPAQESERRHEEQRQEREHPVDVEHADPGTPQKWGSRSCEALRVPIFSRRCSQVVPQFYGRARTESLTPLKRVYPIG